MREQILPELKDDRLSATILKIAAEWAAEAFPFSDRDKEAVVRDRIGFMGTTLSTFQGAMYRPKVGFKF